MDSNSWTSRDPPFPSSATVKYKESMIWKEGSRNISGVQRTLSLLIVETTETALDLLQEKEFALRTGEEKDKTKESPEKWVSWLPLASPRKVGVLASLYSIWLS